MARTPSIMLPLGTEAPEFALPDTDGNTISLEEFRGSAGLVVMFICNHCPFVIHVAPEIAAVAEEYQEQGIGFVAISANDVATHPEDSPEKMKEEKAKRGYTFPYLYDESQAVAKAYHAACTPDFFVFDQFMKLVYRGQLDDSRPGNDKRLDGHDLRGALDNLLMGKPIASEQKPSIGCNIKWKAGAEPAYAK